MDISAITNRRTVDSVRSLSDGQTQAARDLTAKDKTDDGELRKAFDTFVGETFYGQMLGAMRKMNDKPAYFHGGQAEEMFRDQLDQTLSQKLSENTAHSFSGPMFDLFQLNRS